MNLGLFKIQMRLSGEGLWNRMALPTSLQMAVGQARVAGRAETTEVRIVASETARKIEGANLLI